MHTASISSSPARSWPQHTIRFELILFAVVLALANLPVLWGGWNEPLVFFPARVAAGEWWRIVTHALVHVSWYHLLLDGSAFLMLYAELRHWSSTRRLGAVGVCAAGSLLAAMMSPITGARGFCGLSGVAHGLMAIAAIEMIRRSDGWERRAGWVAFGGVVGKGLLEAATGKVVFSFLHFGLIGVPVAACHAGGIIGGLVWMLFQWEKRRRSATVPLRRWIWTQKAVSGAPPLAVRFFKSWPRRWSAN